MYWRKIWPINMIKNCMKSSHDAFKFQHDKTVNQVDGIEDVS